MGVDIVFALLSLNLDNLDCGFFNAKTSNLILIFHLDFCQKMIIVLEKKEKRKQRKLLWLIGEVLECGSFHARQSSHPRCYKIKLFKCWHMSSIIPLPQGTNSKFIDIMVTFTLNSRVFYPSSSLSSIVFLFFLENLPLNNCFDINHYYD